MGIGAAPPRLPCTPQAHLPVGIPVAMPHPVPQKKRAARHPQSDRTPIFRRQMKLGLKLVSIRKPIGLFTWHQDDIAKRLGLHQENALADVDRKSFPMRIAKLFFRLRHLLRGGTLRPFRLEWEIFGFSTGKANSKLFFPRLHLKRSWSGNRICK